MDGVTLEMVKAFDVGPHAVHMVNDVAHDTSEVCASSVRPEVGDFFLISIIPILSRGNPGARISTSRAPG